MRKSAAVAVLVAVTVTAAAPAWAKIPGEATIEGAGLDGAIELTGVSGVEYPMMANLFDGEAGRIQAPTDALGPRYTARFIVHEPYAQQPVVQHLYPFARGGPVLYTPPDQPWLREISRGRRAENRTAPSGWFRMRAELLRELRSHGLPRTPPIPAELSRPVADPSVAGGPSPVVWAIALLGGLLVMVAVARRRAVRPAR